MSSSQLFKLPFKRTLPLDDFSDALLRFIEQSNLSTHPDAVADDCRRLSRMRSNLFDDPSVLTQGGPNVLSNLLAYYAQLTYALTRIPQDLDIEFPWFPVFSTPAAAVAVGGFPAAVPISQSDLEYERSCVLFNIGTIYTHLALSGATSSEAVYKSRIQNFQLASGTFKLLSEQVDRIKSQLQRPVSPDLSKESIEAFGTACLAQAQETFWHKGISDKLKNGTIAKLALQAALLYERAARAARDAKGAQGAWPLFSFPPGLLNHLEFKRRHFQAVAQFRKSIDDLDARRYGHEIGRLAVAEDDLTAGLSKFTKGVADAVVNESKAFLKTIQENRQRATRDNDLIYLDAVANHADLPPIEPAALAQTAIPQQLSDPISFLHDAADGFGQPLLQALRPYEVSAACQVYEDRKVQFFEEQLSRPKRDIDQRIDALLHELRLPAALNAAVEPVSLPSQTIRQAETVRASGGTSKIRDMLHDTRRLSKSIQQALNDIGEMLRKDEVEDNAACSRFGSERWRRPPSQEAEQALQERAKQLQQILDSARQSDALVRNKFAQHEHDIHLLSLSQGELESRIPTVASASADSKSSSRDLRRSLENLSSLQSRVATLLSSTRKALEMDQIGPKIDAEAGRLESSASTRGAFRFEPLLEKELAKYQIHVERMDQLSDEIEGCLARIKLENESFVRSRKERPEAAAREQALQRLDTGFAAFNELLHNLEEGQRFYAEVSKLVAELKEACRQWTAARGEEAKTEVEEMRSDFSTMTLSTPHPGLYEPENHGPIRFG